MREEEHRQRGLATYQAGGPHLLGMLVERLCDKGELLPGGSDIRVSDECGRMQCGEQTPVALAAASAGVPILPTPLSRRFNESP